MNNKALRATFWRWLAYFAIGASVMTTIGLIREAIKAEDEAKEAEACARILRQV